MYDSLYSWYTEAQDCQVLTGLMRTLAADVVFPGTTVQGSTSSHTQLCCSYTDTAVLYNSHEV